MDYPPFLCLGFRLPQGEGVIGFGLAALSHRPSEKRSFNERREGFQGTFASYFDAFSKEHK